MTERLAMWFAWHLPRRVLYWAYIRAAALATQHHPDRTPDDIDLLEALRALGDET